MTYDEARLVQMAITFRIRRNERQTARFLGLMRIGSLILLLAPQFKHPMRGLLWQQLVIGLVTFFAARNTGITEKHNEDFKSGVPYKWVLNLIESSVPWSEQTRRWGYVVLRDEMTDSIHDAWERFLEVADSHLYSRLV
jgi:hypothetical protein